MDFIRHYCFISFKDTSAIIFNFSFNFAIIYFRFVGFRLFKNRFFVYFFFINWKLLNDSGRLNYYWSISVNNFFNFNYFFNDLCRFFDNDFFFDNSISINRLLNYRFLDNCRLLNVNNLRLLLLSFWPVHIHSFEDPSHSLSSDNSLEVWF